MPKALAILEHIVADGAREPEILRRLASLQRGTGDLPGALKTIELLLTNAPLDFLGLLFRASVLEQRGEPGSGEAYGRALAQMPDGDPPPPLRAAIDHARAAYGVHQERLKQRLGSAASQNNALTTDEVSRRVDRFISNISRGTRVWHSEPTHFHFPQLREQEFHDRANFPWLQAWEAATDEITGEYLSAMQSRSAQCVPYIDYADHEPVAQWSSLNRNPEWTAIHLIKQGQVVEANARLCPRTMELLQTIPLPQIPGSGGNAMFSVLAPHTRLPAHVGVANFRLVSHLPLIVPPKCWFRVGAETREWQRGEAFVFDDSIEHEASNDSDETRVVLIVDCWHPDLSEAEREAITRIVGQWTQEIGAI